MDGAMKQSTRQYHKIFFHISISQCRIAISYRNAEKTLQLKITKKQTKKQKKKKKKKIGANIANFTYLYYMSREKLKMEIIQ